jgi:VanZ family protein
MKIKRIILIVLIIIWMGSVFVFSSQSAIDSSSSSEKTTKFIMQFYPGVKTMEEKQEIEMRMNSVVRKMAHYSIYTLGGVLIACFINTYDFSDKKKILYGQIVGTFYAMTDEIHQYFVEGRSSEIRDVFLDSLGIATGIILVMIIYKVIKKKKCL